MSDEEIREFALREADRMRILSSEMRQSGFLQLAKFLNKNADKAMKWVARSVAETKIDA